MSIRLFSDGMPVQSTMLLTDGQFKIAGQLMAMSIVQGGPAPNFLTHPENYCLCWSVVVRAHALTPSLASCSPSLFAVGLH